MNHSPDTGHHLNSMYNKMPGDLLPSVAVVILNWNGKKYLEQFLPALLASSYPNKKIIVADNASTDQSVPFLQTHFPEVEIIQMQPTKDFPKGIMLL